MKIILIAFMLVAVSKTSPVEDIEIEWVNFKIKYNKSYSSTQEELLRFKNFVDSYEYVTRFNNLQAREGEITENALQLGINEYSDLTLDEFPRGLTISENLTEEQSFSLYNESNVGSIPNSIDWRKKGIVTPVKNQKHCRSCWAFSAVGSLEAVYYKDHGKKHILSEQFLVDCDNREFGCNGGDPHLALLYISEHGIPEEKDYPYKTKRGKCKKVKMSPVKNKGVIKLPQNNEKIMEQIVATVGPISAVVYSNTEEFKHYKKGVLKTKCPHKKADHAIVIVGYDTDPKEGDYWIVKNSWGKDWGDNGYIKIPRNKNSFCGIAYHSSFPAGV